MQLSKTHASLFASHLLVSSLIVYAAWQFFDKSARFPLMGIIIIYQLLMVLKGYDLWRKGMGVLAWGLTVVLPLMGLLAVYFTLHVLK